MTDLPDVVFSTPEMSAIFSGPSRVQRMLDFEAALARAEARAGIVPAGAAAAIADRCDAAAFDMGALFESTSITGTLAVPLVQALTELVGDDTKGFVHWGATSQDAIDTGVVLQLREGLDAIIEDLLHTGRSCLDVAESHRHTPMVGRTLLQHALPITLGLKAAHWLSATTRRIERLRQLRGELVLQFGGAAGTLAALGVDGVRVAEFLAEELNLELPDMPWHTDRDRIGDIAAALAVVAGTAGKIAHDITLLKQTEVHEANISGEGVSSAMPHKRNPVKGTLAAASVELALGATHTVVSAMVQEHERSLGGWQTEWAALPDAFRFTASAVRQVSDLIGNLEIDPERMRANLDLTRGLVMAEALVMALASRFGRNDAFRIVDEACRAAREQDEDLRVVAASDARISEVLSSAELDRVFDPLAYLGAADHFIDSAIASFGALDGDQG